MIDSVAPAGATVVLVGHSGGAIAHAAADARPGRVARVIYVDSLPLGEGGLINDELPVEDGEVPLPDWSLFEKEDLVDLDDDLRAAFRAQAIPTPVHVTSDRQRLSDERRYDVPVTVIACEFSCAQLREWMAQDHPAVRELGRIRDVGYIDLPTGHWPQFTKPGELSQAILASTGPAFELHSCNSKENGGARGRTWCGLGVITARSGAELGRPGGVSALGMIRGRAAGGAGVGVAAEAGAYGRGGAGACTGTPDKAWMPRSCCSDDMVVASMS